MKITPLIPAILLSCVGLVASVSFPAWADSHIMHSTDATTDAEESSAATPSDADLLLVEPRRVEVANNNPDPANLNDVANQINQVIEVDSSEFLPDGVVVRGSEGSLQLGSEI